MFKNIVSKWYVQFGVLMVAYFGITGILAIVAPMITNQFFGGLDQTVVNTLADTVVNLITTGGLLGLFFLLCKGQGEVLGFNFGRGRGALAGDVIEGGVGCGVGSEAGSRNFGVNSWNLVKGMLVGFAAMLVGFAAMGLIYLVLVLTGQVSIVNKVIPKYLVSYLLFFFSVAVVEEILSRGVLQGVIKKEGKVWLSILFPSIFFGLIHMSNPGVSPIGVINTILAGVLFALSTYVTGSIYWAIGFHFTWNYFQSIIFGMKVSGIDFPEGKFMYLEVGSNNIINGGSYGVEGGLLCTAVFGVIILWLFVKFRKRRQSEKCC